MSVSNEKMSVTILLALIALVLLLYVALKALSFGISLITNLLYYAAIALIGLLIVIMALSASGM